MNRQRTQAWMLWMLPLLALRLLLPAGVMPGSEAGRAVLLECRGGYLAAVAVYPSPAPSAPAAPDRHGSGGGHVCPFAAAAIVAPPLSVAMTHATPRVHAATLPLSRPQHISACGPARSQLSRAPPLFS